MDKKNFGAKKICFTQNFLFWLRIWSLPKLFLTQIFGLTLNILYSNFLLVTHFSFDLKFVCRHPFLINNYFHHHFYLPKIFAPKISLVQNIFFTNFFRLKIVLETKFFKDPNFFGPLNFVTKYFFVHTMFGPTFFCTHNFLDQNFFSLKHIWQKNFLTQIFLS